jgi:hypothetical protein
MFSVDLTTLEQCEEKLEELFQDLMADLAQKESTRETPDRRRRSFCRANAGKRSNGFAVAQPSWLWGRRASSLPTRPSTTAATLCRSRCY